MRLYEVYLFDAGMCGTLKIKSYIYLYMYLVEPKDFAFASHNHYKRFHNCTGNIQVDKRSPLLNKMLQSTSKKHKMRFDSITFIK